MVAYNRLRKNGRCVGVGPNLIQSFPICSTSNQSIKATTRHHDLNSKLGINKNRLDIVQTRSQSKYHTPPYRTPDSTHGTTHTTTHGKYVFIKDSAADHTSPQYVVSHGEEIYFCKDETSIQNIVNQLSRIQPRLVTIREMVLICEHLQANSTDKALRVSTRFLRNQVVLRLAHRIKELQQLPYIVGMNPYIHRLYESQLESFTILYNIRAIDSKEQEEEFANILRDVVEKNSDYIDTLKRGIQQTQKYFKGNKNIFLRNCIQSRVSMRTLVEHYLAIREPRQQKGFSGIICNNLEVRLTIKKCTDIVNTMSEQNYGVSVPFIIDGQVESSFSFIPAHLEYILIELLKNSVRATIEHHKKTPLSEEEAPPIRITICKGKREVSIRISDQGGGIPPENLEHIWDYSFTTVPEASENTGGYMDMGDLNGNVPTIAGLGFGMPLARIHAEYFGGSLELCSMENFGCDVYLRLNYIGDKLETFAKYE